MTMSADFPFNDATSDSDSRDCENIVVDCVGDSTVRPVRPELRQYLLALRERMARWEAQRHEENPGEAPPNGSQSEQGT